MKINGISVLDTLADNAADAFVDSSGMLNVTNWPEQVKATNIKSVSKTVYAAETLGVWTVTPTAQNSYHYEVQVVYYPNGLNNPSVMKTVTYDTPASGATATTICNNLRTSLAAQISSNYIAGSGSATFILTAIATFPIFYVYNNLNDANIAIVNTTPGVERIGLGADLLATYKGATAGATVGLEPLSLGNLSTISPTGHYTQWRISGFSNSVHGTDWTGEFNAFEYLIFVNESPATASSVNAATQLALIQGTFGTLTQLKLGYKAIPTDNVTTTALITVTTGVITLAGGAVTFSTLGAMPGDALMISVSADALFTTFATTKIQSIGATQLLGIGDNIVASPASGQLFKYISIRNLPL